MPWTLEATARQKKAARHSTDRGCLRLLDQPLRLLDDALWQSHAQSGVGDALFLGGVDGGAVATEAEVMPGEAGMAAPSAELHLARRRSWPVK